MKTINVLLLAAVLSTKVFSASSDRDGLKPDYTRIDLNGAWVVSASGSNDWFTASVPGCVHTDLLAANRIPDPFYRDNEKKIQWISELGWTYRRSFQVTEDLLQRKHLLLRCEGLDTLATVLVNGVEVGQTDNMYRLWEFDVKKLLKVGSNNIEVRFAPALPFIRSKEAEQHLPTWQYPGAAYIRKMPCNFGWDWGPTVVTCGIWRNIALVAYDTARLDDVRISQDHGQKDKVKLTVQVFTQSAPSADLKVQLVLTSPDGKPGKPVESTLINGQGTVELTVQRPQLWWPAGMGKQPLYTVKADLLDAQGKLLDATQRRIGLRTMRVLEQTNSTPMQFVVNGIPYFAKGANWIPADAFPTRSTKAQLRQFMADAVAVNMNSLRFWGGGYYEDDKLFDACDELGICVWMDFKFACSTYPAYDPNFLANVRQEAGEQVKRLRHHPSIAVWCGNNEIMFFRGGNEWKWVPKEKIGSDESNLGKMSAPDYNRLFKDTLGGVMRELAPQSAYVTGSPDCGDVHFWDVWHGGKPFDAYRGIHGFISEFGFQSFPVPATAAAFTASEDRNSVYSPMFKHHERSNRSSVDSIDDGQIGTDKIMKIVRMNFREPKDFENTLWLSQINQAYGIEFAAEGWRREMPKSMGCVYWQYNDNWPSTSWSSVDYFGRWKALQYRAKHFYSPVLVSGDFNSTNGMVALWLTSDELKPVQGKLNWRVTDVAGNELGAGKLNVTQAAQTSSVVGTIDLGKLVSSPGGTNLLVWLKFDGGGKLTTDNVVLLARPKQLQLLDPQLSFTVSGSGTNYTVTVRAGKPALWVWLDIPGVEARFSDNFIHIAPGAPAKFNVQLTKPMSRSELLKTLQAQSLFSTYNK